MRSLRDDAAKRIGEKAAAPELQARPARPIAENVASLVPHAIHACHVDAVGNRVTALDRLPRVILRRAELLLLRRMPADRRRVKQHFGALQRSQPRSFGIPLIPAHQRADTAKGCIDCLETEIARREIELLVIQRIVRECASCDRR